ncbi:hypothetical protein [Mesorhizobium mediterraneum]|uniref:hypothetical protein n=1 Tax=Mesorhizobium mediterraneum TaxID=43617 RepID=UPI001780F7E8|nr:hypothetical protein [Mesorhizobium mediterraneum]
MNVFGRQVVTCAVWAAVDSWGRQIAMFGVFVVLARHLGPESFGLAALATGRMSSSPVDDKRERQ